MQYPTQTFRLKIMATLVVSIFVAPQLAASADNTETLEAGKVDVVGTTPLSSLGVPLDDVPYDVTMIKATALKQQQSLTLADALNQNLAGVNVNETQGNPYQPDVSFHGFEASPLLGSPVGLSVYQDGVRINEPFGDTVNWDLIPRNAIASISVIPGSNPLYGLNTLGGAIAVQTKSGENYPGGGIQAYGGSFNRRAVEGEYGGKTDNGLSYFFAGNYFKEDGWRDFSPSEVNQGFGKLGWQGEKTDIDVSLTLADNNMTGNGVTPFSMLRNLGYSSVYTIPDNTKNKLGFLNGKISHWFTDDLVLTTNAYYRNARTATFNGDANNDYQNPGDNEGAIHRTNTLQNGFGITSQLTWSTDKNQATVGLGYDKANISFGQGSEEFLAFNASRGIDYSGLDATTLSQDVSLKGHTTTWSLFGTDTYKLTSQLSLIASGRYNNTRVSNYDQLIPDATDPSSLTSTQTFQRFNPSLGLTYTPEKDLNFYGSYNQGSRAPSTIELGCANPLVPCKLPNAFAGDPPLKQVVAKTFEGGVRGKFTANTHWSMGAYRTENQDDIQFIVADPVAGTGYFNNVGQTLRKGIDLALSQDLNDFTWSAGYSFVDATYESAFQLANTNNTSSSNGVIQVSPGDSIPGIPKHRLKLRGEWRAIPNLSLCTNLVLLSGQYALGNENNQDASGGGRVGGYSVVNLDGRYKLGNSGWQVFANVNNVFDRKYYTAAVLGTNQFTAAGIFQTDTTQWTNETFATPGAPRAAWIGVRWEFGGAKATTADNN